MEPRAARRAVRAGDRRADALEHDAEPAHRPLHHVARHRHSRRSAARDRAGSRRRLRQQDPADPGRLHHGVLLDEARASGEVDTRRARENYQSTTHGRDHVQDVELAATKDGRILGLRCTVWAGHGRLPLDRRARHPDDSSRPDAVGPVHDSRREGRRLRRLHEHDAGRGVSRRRPSGSDVHARADDRPARRQDRRRSGRGPQAQPDSAVRRTATTSSPASPTTAATTKARFDKALDARRLRRSSATSRRRRARRGGTSASASAIYVEICGLGPSQVAGAVGFQGGLWESAIVRFHPSGKVHVFIGASPHGQGEETTFAQIVADELGVGVDDVKVVHGDTDNTPMGWGTYGSRTTAVGGAALAVATRKIKEKAKLLDEPSARSRRRGHRLRRRQVLRARARPTSTRRFRTSR